MVQYLKYNGKQLPLRISYLALKALSKDDKITDLSSIMTADITVLETLLFHGLRAGHRAVGVPFDIPMEDMEYILDESYEDFITILPTFFEKFKESKESNNEEQLPKK